MLEKRPTHELHLPLPHTLHLYSAEVRQVVVLIPQGILLQAEGGQASRSIPARENAIRTIWEETKEKNNTKKSGGIKGVSRVSIHLSSLTIISDWRLCAALKKHCEQCQGFFEGGLTCQGAS